MTGLAPRLASNTQRISQLIQRIALLEWPDELPLSAIARLPFSGPNHVRIVLSSPVGFNSFGRPVGGLRDWLLVHVRLSDSASCWDFTFKRLALRRSVPLYFGRRNSSGSISILS